MTIYKLERESTAWQVINILHGIHANISSMVLWLEDTTRSITTVDVITTRSSWTNTYTLINDFNTEYGNWFASSWSDYVNALSGAISSLQTIGNAINQGIHDWYWDYDTDKPIMSEISQEHRNKLATLIKAELG